MHILLRQGSTGSEVKRIQKLLNDHLHLQPPLRMDGIFGPLTEHAVRQYQLRTGLVRDGVVGLNTWQAFEAATLHEKESSNLPVNPYNAPWVVVAMREYGQKEISEGDNPRILAYHATTSLRATTDEDPWCSAFVNWCLRQAGIAGTNSAAAISWLHWGRVSTPRTGAVCVVQRRVGGHHVGFFIEERHNSYRVLGGNQGGQVKFSNLLKSSHDVLGYRWPRN